jgi:class 3 adenylate cyclase
MSSSPLRPIPHQVSVARHDLRNPLGEIQGFADILTEEARELGHEVILVGLQALSHATGAILKQVNQTLTVEHLEASPADSDSLGRALLLFSQETAESADALHARCSQLAGQPFLEDLARIRSSAEQLGERAPGLLAGMFATEHVIPAELEQVGGTDGETVFFRKPSATVTAAAGSEDTTFLTRAEVRPPSTGTILVVDDTESNRALLTRRLSREGFTVAVAEDGRRALDMLSRHAFDLVLLDIMMPEMDGHQVLTAMKSDFALRHLPVIMISGLDDLETLVRCIEGGADDYLTKPFDPVLLRARIGACLDKKRLRDKERELLQQVRDAQEKSEALLLNILPRRIADRLKAGESTIADTLPAVTVLFADLAGFTEMSARITGTEMVRLLDELFTTFDLLAQEQGLEKIKTIGDAYMVVGGLPDPRPDHAHAVAELALNMLEAVERKFADSALPVRVRIGINSGPVVAGVIGRHKFSYDLWGDTVNTASRMESHGVTGAIQVSAATHQLIESDYNFTRRELSQVKGKGAMTAWLLTGRRSGSEAQ